MTTRLEHIENTVSGLVGDFLYYDRKDDEVLPQGAIEQAISDGEITVEALVQLFETELRKGLL